VKKDKLSCLQRRILIALSDMEPSWTLTGGAALAGFYTGHRETRDLDLFWHGTARLERLPQQVRERLRAERFDAETIQTETSFARLRASDRGDVVVVDLVADSSKLIEEPALLSLEGRGIFVDTLHEILVNKLCALLGRTELRDLDDVQAILGHGGDLERAIRDAPEKDGGFSGTTLSWILHRLPVTELGAASKLSPAEVAPVTIPGARRSLRPAPPRNALRSGAERGRIAAKPRSCRDLGTRSNTCS
jgi:hypothetical protein